MQSGKESLLLSMLVLGWLAGCVAPAPRPSEAPPPARPQVAPAIGTMPTKPQTPVSPVATKQYERAITAMQAKRDKQAEKILLSMTRQHPDLAGPYVNLGIIYYRSARVREAEQAFRTAIRISPERADSYNHLGILLRESGRFSEARQTYKDALERDPFYAYAHLNLGILYDLYLLDSANALNHYELYQKLVPAPDPEVTKWIVDLTRRVQGKQRTAKK